VNKLILSTTLIALTAIGLGGCAVHPHHGYGYQSPPYYSGGYRNYGNDRGYYRNYQDYGNHGYGHHGHRHGGRYDDD